MLGLLKVRYAPRANRRYPGRNITKQVRRAGADCEEPRFVPFIFPMANRLPARFSATVQPPPRFGLTVVTVGLARLVKSIRTELKLFVEPAATWGLAGFEKSATAKLTVVGSSCQK